MCPTKKKPSRQTNGQGAGLPFRFIVVYQGISECVNSQKLKSYQVKLFSQGGPKAKEEVCKMTDRADNTCTTVRTPHGHERTGFFCWDSPPRKHVGFEELTRLDVPNYKLWKWIKKKFSSRKEDVVVILWYHFTVSVSYSTYVFHHSIIWGMRPSI